MDESVIKHLEQPQQVGTLKLSEAIRIGARLRPKCTGQFFSVDGGSCALGAAWEGMGFNPDAATVYEEVCPKLGISARIAESISGRNDGWIGDRGCWSREEIAAWLERQGL